MLIYEYKVNKNMKQDNIKDYLSVKELADRLGVSRVTIFKKIKNGQIKGEKIGRNYIIPKSELGETANEELTDKLKKEIEKGVNKVISEYGETLKRLGKE